MNVSTIRQALHQQPFEPFWFRLADGREFPVPDPDVVAINERAVVVVDPIEHGFTILDPAQIVALDGWQGNQAKDNSSDAI